MTDYVLGGRPEIENVLSFIDRLADQARMIPQLPRSALWHMPSIGWLDNANEREVQMLAMLYTVLQCPTKSHDRLGAVYNYAADEDIKAVLHVRNADIGVDIEGRLMGSNNN